MGEFTLRQLFNKMSGFEKLLEEQIMVQRQLAYYTAIPNLKKGTKAHHLFPLSLDKKMFTPTTLEDFRKGEEKYSKLNWEKTRSKEHTKKALISFETGEA